MISARKQGNKETRKQWNKGTRKQQCSHVSLFSCSHGQKGFTLFEILVVFGLIALMSAITVVYLRSYQSTSILNSSARDVLSNLRLASELASTTQITHSVRFDIQNSKYQITSASNPENAIKITTLDPSISIAATTLTDQTAQFNNLGAAIASGTITLTNDDGAQKIIDLRPSGYVEIH